MDSNYALLILLTAITLVFVLVWILVAVPQRRARQNQEQVLQEIKVGEEVVTVGGLIGRLTQFDRERDIAQLEIAKGIEVRVIPAAISHPLDYMQRVKDAERKATQKK